MKQIIRKIKNVVEPSYNFIYKQCIKLFYYLPVKQNKIVFIQGDGDGYFCNLKYIAEEIIRQNLDYDMIWMVNRMNEYIPYPIRKVKYNRIKAVYELATAHFLINNLKSYIPVIKKDGQKFIYIPHGQPGAKRAEADAILSEEYKIMSRQHSSLTDIFVSMGKYHTKVLKDTFWVPQNAEIWEIGFPRNDQYFRNTAEIQKKIRLKLRIPNKTKIAYYAPTFRDHGTSDAFDLDLERVLDTLERKTGDKWIMFTTLHYNFTYFAKPNFKYSDRILNMTSYPDLHELFLIVDLCITDYSSVSLDFANTRRPVFIYASDIDEYQRLRGLKQMFFSYPFPFAHNNDEMERNIMMYDKNKRRQMFDDWIKNVYGSVDDGYAAKRFVDKLQIL